MEKEVMEVSSETAPAEENQEAKKEPTPQAPLPIVRVPVKHTNLGIRSPAMDMSTMVELTSFSNLGKIQPFLVTISATAALLVDLHCHLMDKEVCGYLGGYWDINTHNLSILGAYPCRYAGKDKSAAAAVETEISKAMEWKKMTLVGWYHSHPRSHASPSLRDVDAQLDYQIKMKGASDNGYTPCVGLICSPYNTDVHCYESNFNVFWSMPPPENRPHEYPRPMLLSYTLTQEQFISQDVLEEIKKCIEYYKLDGGIDFTSKFNENVTYLERLKNSLAAKLPGRNNRTNDSYWELIKEMVAPGFNDGTEPTFTNMKFPLINDPVSQTISAAPATNVFLTPVNFKPENSISAVQKAYALQQQAENASENNHVKETNSSAKTSPHLISTPESIPTFRTGELTVSLKNSKNDYDYSHTDFTKVESMGKGRNDYTLADLAQPMKFPDLAKLANFSPAEFAKLTDFSLNDFTKAAAAATSSAYMRNIANLFGGSPLLGGSKGMSEPPLPPPPPPPERNDRRSASNDYPEIIAFKPPNASSPAPIKESRNSSTISISSEDYSVPEKKCKISLSVAEAMDTSEDLSMSSSKTDYGTSLNMSTKSKHHQTIDSGESLDLTKERQ
ncbi:myb-like protein H [Copidosoma floridanum]|uniref:myb-like protein H n=1 Tax=Copidosoma floridanum TaxID=29053 RepID=UPI0006C9DB4D|nr:myb-like protein H [Copidosoma floridanum]